MEGETQSVTAVVAAYNEAPRIGQVLEVLTTYPGFREVIVVDDGSTDGTAEVASSYPVTCLRVEPNQGKGNAMDVGVKHASTDVIFFADADIVGLTHGMIEEAARPVLDGTCEMLILMRNRKIYVLHRIMAFIPLLGGERALTKRLWTVLPDRYKEGFRIEAGLNFYAVHYGAGIKFGVFKGISQTVKEAKFGFWEGFRRRLRMFAEVMGAAWDLQWNDLPETDRSRRFAAGMVTLSALGMLFGMLIVAAGIAGPLSFFSSLFAEELSEDPTAPFALAVIRVAAGLGASALLAAGGLILSLNGAFFLRGVARLLTIGRIRDPA
ncbi:MAG: glycosyltransferase family 2 protein [Acidimicrobiia bacterium]